ncbi:MAG: hypothetical protein GWP36_08880 [Bacteroidetes bacterium]|nr:hypothetical protein [Bacteroidota bacterium]
MTHTPFLKRPKIFKISSLRKASDWYPAKCAGFTLVELLVYMVLFSFLSIGVTTIVLQLKTTHSTTNSFVEDSHSEDIAVQRIQNQLGNSDSISVDNVSLGDNACLRLIRDDSEVRKGYRFNGVNQSFNLQQGKIFQPAANSPRSISVWVYAKPTQNGVNTIVKWGGSGNFQKFAVVMKNGRPELDLGCATITFPGAPDIRDLKWHHVVVTYEKVVTYSAYIPGQGFVPISKQYKSELYVDGKRFLSKYSSPCGLPIANLNTVARDLVVGADDTNPVGHFDGALSDLRVFSKAVTAADVQALFSDIKTAQIQTQTAISKWPMNSVSPSSLQVPFEGTSHGAASFLTGFASTNPIFTTLKESPRVHSFCFLDGDGDKLYDLWESDTALAVPKGVGEPGWTLRSKDVFVPSNSGFFSALGDDPDSVTGNFAVGRMVGGKRDLTPKEKSKGLSTRRKTKHKELCVVVPKPTLQSGICQFDSLHIGVANYDKAIDGKIGVLYATETRSGSNSTFTNLHNLPSEVEAKWNADAGILTFYTKDKKTMATSQWLRALKLALYHPKSSMINAKQKFLIGLGGLPFKQANGLHFYDFVDATSYPHRWGTAEQSAAVTNAKFCGMPSYLATITSEDENNHMERVFTLSHGTWPDGWIGAWAQSNSHIRDFQWRTGPEKGTIFWYRSGVDGRAVTTTTPGIPVTPTEYVRLPFDPQPTNPASFWRRTIIDKQGRDLHYSNFSFGNITGNGNNLGTFFCEPVIYSGQNFLSIQGTQSKGGMWFTNPSSNRNPKCEAGYAHTRICGHYREFSGAPSMDPTAVLAEEVTVDMERFTEFCEE